MSKVVRPLMAGAVIASLVFVSAPVEPAQADSVCAISYTAEGASPGNVKVTMTWDPQQIYKPYWDSYQKSNAAAGGVKIEVIPFGGGYYEVYGAR